MLSGAPPQNIALRVVLASSPGVGPCVGLVPAVVPAPVSLRVCTAAPGPIEGLREGPDLRFVPMAGLGVLGQDLGGFQRCPHP